MKFTKRERDIIRQVALGNANKEIGYVLGIASATVKVYVSRVLRKTQASSRLQLVGLAMVHGIVTVPEIEATCPAAARRKVGA
jgi:DNA-binding NarL/FixJ family response regulator